MLSHGSGVHKSPNKVWKKKQCITLNAKIHLFPPGKLQLNLAKSSFERNSPRKEELTIRMHLTLFRELTAKGRPSRWLSGKESAYKCRRHSRYRFDSWVKKIPWRKKWQLTPVLLPGKSHGQRSLVGYSSWGHKESDRAEQDTWPKIFQKTMDGNYNLLLDTPLLCLSGEESYIFRLCGKCC